MIFLFLKTSLALLEAELAPGTQKVETFHLAEYHAQKLSGQSI